MRGWFVYKVSRSAMFTSNYGTTSLSFYCLSNLDFDSLIRLGNWFNCLLLLMHIRSKIESRTEKSRLKSGITLLLFDRNLKRLVCGGC